MSRLARLIVVFFTVSLFTLSCEPDIVNAQTPPDSVGQYVEHLHKRWVPMKNCEENDNPRKGPTGWQSNTGNGYYGGLQFSADTWRRAGGTQFASRADLADSIQQMHVAEQWLRRTSWKQWPVCSREVGYRE